MPGTRVYLYVGGHEGPDMATDAQKMADLFKVILPAQDISMHFNAAGAHNESVWRAEFPKAVRWLFAPAKQ